MSDGERQQTTRAAPGDESPADRVPLAARIPGVEGKHGERVRPAARHRDPGSRADPGLPLAVVEPWLDAPAERDLAREPSIWRTSSRVGASPASASGMASVMRTLPPAVLKVVSTAFVSGR